MLSEVELNELKEVLENITTHIPENKAVYVWDTYTKISGDKGPRPCMCSSAGKYWKAAVDELRNYIKDK